MDPRYYYGSHKLLLDWLAALLSRVDELSRRECLPSGTSGYDPTSGGTVPSSPGWFVQNVVAADGLSTGQLLHEFTDLLSRIDSLEGYCRSSQTGMAVNQGVDMLRLELAELRSRLDRLEKSEFTFMKLAASLKGSDVL